jgi:predicted ArsR family transcriptional regulator
MKVVWNGTMDTANQMARQRRTTLEPLPPTSVSVSREALIAYVEANPGLTCHDIAPALGGEFRAVASTLYRLCRDGGLRVSGHLYGFEGRPRNRYAAARRAA